MQWSEWVESGCEAPLLARVALGHYQLSVLSPVAYSDHLSRLYITLALIKEGALRDPLLPISEWLSRERNNYKSHLLALVHYGDLDGFLRFFAEGTAVLCRNQMRLIHRLERVTHDQLGRLGRRVGGNVRGAKGLAPTPLTSLLHV